MKDLQLGLELYVCLEVAGSLVEGFVTHIPNPWQALVYCPSRGGCFCELSETAAFYVPVVARQPKVEGQCGRTCASEQDGNEGARGREARLQARLHVKEERRAQIAELKEQQNGTEMWRGLSDEWGRLKSRCVSGRSTRSHSQSGAPRPNRCCNRYTWQEPKV